MKPLAAGSLFLSMPDWISEVVLEEAEGLEVEDLGVWSLDIASL